jgi:hypothetical protein
MRRGSRARAMAARQGTGHRAADGACRRAQAGRRARARQEAGAPQGAVSARHCDHGTALARVAVRDGQVYRRDFAMATGREERLS